MNTSNAREQRANEEIDIELEYERVRKQRYEDFQEWLNKCPLVVTDYQDYTTEFQITFNLEGLMRLSDQVKIKAFDKYIMRGGDQSLQNIEDLCDFGFNMCQLGYDPEQFNDVVIDVICKLTEKLEDNS